MQRSVVHHLCSATLVANFLAIPLAAEDTYSLRGEGAHTGMVYTGKQVFRMTVNGVKSLQSINARTAVTKVSGDGEITSATMTILGDESDNAKSTEEDPLAGVYNKPLNFNFDGKTWTITSLDADTTRSEAEKALADLGFGPSLNRHQLPLISVPVGFKWSRDESEGFAGIDSRNAKFLEMMKGMKGKANYVFDSVKTVNGVSCAAIKCTFSYKGNFTVPDAGNAVASGKFTGTTTELRRLDTGLQVRLECTASFNASMSGGKIAMDIESQTTVNMISE